jgi:hypothetical protein
MTPTVGPTTSPNALGGRRRAQDRDAPERRAGHALARMAGDGRLQTDQVIHTPSEARRSHDNCVVGRIVQVPSSIDLVDG